MMNKLLHFFTNSEVIESIYDCLYRAHKKTITKYKRSPIKITTITLLVALSFFEIVRKTNLYDLGVPFFVLDGEPIITHYAYGKVTLLSFGLLVFGWIVIFLYFLSEDISSKIGKILLLIFSSGSVVFLVFLIGGILQYNLPVGDMIYLSKDYEVYKTASGSQVKMDNRIFNCIRKSVFQDICIKAKN